MEIDYTNVRFMVALKLDPVAHGAEIVADMELAGRLNP
jgi:hypothetical protein